MANSLLDNKQFMSLFFNFIDLKHISEEDKHFTINSLLDEFNSLNYKTLFIQNNTYGITLISHVIKQVSPEDSFLVAKGSRLIVNLVNKQRVPLYKDEVVPSVEWFIIALKTCSDIVLCDILEGLSSVLKGNALVLTKYHKNLMACDGILSSILKTTTNSDPANSLNCPSDLTLHVLKCLESLISINEDSIIKNNEEPCISIEYLEFCGNIFLKYLYQNKIKNQDDINFCQILTTCLSGIRYLIRHPINWISTRIGDILGAVKVHIFHGLSNGENLFPQKVMPSQQPIPENINNNRLGRGGKMLRTRKQKINNKKSSGAAGDTKLPSEAKFYTALGDFCPFGNTVTSESEFSDSESSVIFRITQNQTRVRQKSLELLLATIRAVNRHEMFGYWHSLMPSCPNDSNRSLSTCFLFDPSPRCRNGALTALTAMLSGSRDYLWHADKSDKKITAFTPFSVVLGGILSALHRALGTAILQEQSIPVIIQILKCSAALIQVTPYHRLENGLLTNLISGIKKFAKHKDVAVQVSALISFCCAVSVQPSIPEFSALISQPFKNNKIELACSLGEKFCKNADVQHTSSIDSNQTKSEKTVTVRCYESYDEDFEDENLHELDINNDNLHSNSTPSMSWLLQICLGNLGIGTEPAPVHIRIESLNVLTAIGSSYFFLFEGNLESLSAAIKSALLDRNIESKLNAGKTLDVIGYAINSYLSNEDLNKKISSYQCYIFWQSLLTPLMGLIQDTQNSSLRSIACDCLGNIGNEVFKHFARDQQIFVITNLFGCTRDMEPLVRAASVRALAVCVEIPTLREDFGFIMDTADAVINLLKESHMQIRIKAYWSLGNLSAALLHAVLERHEEVPESMLETLLQSGIVGLIKYNDRIQFNAMRAVGSLLRILNSKLIENPKWKSLITEAIKKLTSPTGTMKVFWNACYALGNVLRNNYLFENSVSIEWQKLIYEALNGLVVKSPNFKVRISAAASLAIPKQKQHYGSYYCSVWSSLILALDYTNNMDDFAECKHRDNLVDQICISLAHLINLATIDDVCNLHNIACTNIDIMHMDMSRVTGRLLPERSSYILNACTHIQTMIMENKMSSEQKNAAQKLLSIFTV